MKKNILYLLIGLCIIFAAMAVTLFHGQYQAQENYDIIPDDNKLIIYTSHEENVYGPIIKEFEERTGIWVEVVTGGTNEMLDRITQEDGENSGDIMFGGGVDSLNAYSDYFQSYECKQQNELMTTYQSEDHKWVAFSSLPIVFVYNNKLVYSAGVPRSWGELLDGQFKGKIAYADPRKSGTSYTALMTMLQIKSEDEELDDTMENFVTNLNGYLSASSSSVIDDVMSGKKLIGITQEEKAFNSVKTGADLRIVYPSEGTTALPDGCAIIANAPHRKNAELFLEFTVSKDVQQYIADECYRRPVRLDIAQKPLGNEIPYNLDWADTHQFSILEKWTTLVDKEAEAPCID